MKKYDRIKKQWVDEKDLTPTSLKTRKTCRGGRPHNFLLVLPDYLAKPTRELTQDEILEYYKSEDRIADFFKGEKNRLLQFGIDVRYGYSRSNTRYLECEICRKKDYEYRDKLSTA